MIPGWRWAALFPSTLLALGGAAEGAEVLSAEVGGDASFRLELGGSTQVELRHTEVDGARFAVSRSRVEVAGRLRGGEAGPPWWFTQRATFEITAASPLRDGFLEVGRPGIALRAGQFKPQLMRTELTSQARGLMPRRPSFTRWLPTRDVGAMLHGHLGEHHLVYGAGVFNGQGVAGFDPDGAWLWTARVAASPLGGPPRLSELLPWQPGAPVSFTVGVSGSVHHRLVDGEAERRVGMSVESFFYGGPLTAQAELLTQTVRAEEGMGRRTAVYAQAGLFPAGIPWAQDHLALLARVEEVGGAVPVGEAPTGVPWLGLGVGFYPARALTDDPHAARLILVYSLLRDPVDGGSAGGFTAQASAIF